MNEKNTIETPFDFFDRPFLKGCFDISYLKEDYEYRKKLSDFEESRGESQSSGTSIIVKWPKDMPIPPKDYKIIDPREVNFEQYLYMIVENESHRMFYNIENTFLSITLGEEKKAFLISIHNKLTSLIIQYSELKDEEVIFNNWLNQIQVRFLKRFDNDLSAFNVSDPIGILPSEKKIKTNLSRIELTILFYLLRQADMIDKNVTSYRIGKLLEENFKYKSGTDYKELLKVQDIFSKIKRGDISIETAIKTIKYKISMANIPTSIE
jgi:hypothetical protein